MDNNSEDKLIPIRPGLFELAPEPRLTGSICPNCSKKFFPARQVCTNCFHQGLEKCLLSSSGKVRIFTTVHARPPKGFTSPYSVGYVDLLEEKLTIPAILTGELTIGADANLVIEPLSNTADGAQVLVYKFQVEGPVKI